MMKKTIGIIGFGNMGRAITQGLLAKKTAEANHIIVSDTLLPVSDQGIICTTDNTALVTKADVIILALKPQVMQSVLENIKDIVKKDQLVISIAAGITIKNFQKVFGSDQPIVRAMPNLNAKVGESMTAWVATDAVSGEQKQITKEIFAAIGKELPLASEDMINSFTAVAGSGPAYVFFLAQMMQEAAMQSGFSADDAKALVYQTLQGSIQTLLTSSESAEILRQQVTSKGGTTEAAFTEFEKNNIGEILLAGIKKAKERAEELAI